MTIPDDGRRPHWRIEAAGRAIYNDPILRCFWAFFVVVAIVCWVFR